MKIARRKKLLPQKRPKINEKNEEKYCAVPEKMLKEFKTVMNCFICTCTYLYINIIYIYTCVYKDPKLFCVGVEHVYVY